MEKAKKTLNRASPSVMSHEHDKKNKKRTLQKSRIASAEMEWYQGAFIKAEQFFPRVNAENGVVRRVLRARLHSSSLIINVEKFVSKKNTEEYRETLEIIHIKYSR